MGWVAWTAAGRAAGFSKLAHRWETGAVVANRPLAMAATTNGRRYWPGPLTVSSSRWDSILPSSVQMAAWPSLFGLTVIRQRRLLPTEILLRIMARGPFTIAPGMPYVACRRPFDPERYAPVPLLAQQTVLLVRPQLNGHVQHIVGVACLQMAEDGECVCHPGHGYVQCNPLEIQAFVGVQQS